MKAEIIINKEFKIGEIDKRLYGSFIEHVGRVVYGGIYEPTHKTADTNGFRKDVVELVKKLNVPIIRYPGGNFVSGYNWEDGTGDKAKRPKRLDVAWDLIETNEVGIDELQEWAKQIDAEVLMAVNLGTRGPQDAQNLVEYCNLNTDTYYANMRKKNGFKEPFGIKTWCLGNEVYAWWQIGHKTAEEYGRIALETAKLMKRADPDIELVACGTSGNKVDDPQWELTVLDHTYDYVDYICLHQYYGKHDQTTADYLGMPVRMDTYIKSVAAMCDAIKWKKRSDKTINLAFDEWNVQYHNNDQRGDKWSIAPAIFEDVYTFEDALVVGCMLITLQNNCDRVKIACLAQLVNTIAPIMTENGGAAWAQTIFYPFMYSSLNGRGTALQTIVKCDSYKTTDNQTTPYIEASVIHNEEKRELTVFAVNRSLDEDMELSLDLEGFEGVNLEEHIELYSDDLQSINTKENAAVFPKNRETTEKVTLKKHSWNMLLYKY